MRVRAFKLNLAGTFLVLLCLIALFSDFLSANHPEEQNLSRFFCPPTRIHFFDKENGACCLPFVCSYELSNPLEVIYTEQTKIAHPLSFFSKGYSYRMMGLIPASRHLAGCPGGAFHPLGTDELGRDVMARLLAGTRTSLLVVFLGTCVCAAIGLIIGLTAGFSGGWVDALLMRFSEFVLALPALYLILALRAILPVKLPFWQTLLLTVGTIAVIAWPPAARSVRGLVLQIRRAGYVEAARALGSSPWRIISRHIIPALVPNIVSQAIVIAPVFLLGEIVLSFLDVGFHDSGESWGTMLRNIKDPRILTDFWWNLAPLVMIVFALYLMNQLGNRAASTRKEKRPAMI